MRLPIGDRLEAAIFVIVVLLVAKFVVRKVSGGAYAHFAEDF